MAKGYWIAFGVKPLHIVDETFCLIPTETTIVVTWIVLSPGHQRRDVNLQKGDPAVVYRSSL